MARTQQADPLGEFEFAKELPRELRTFGATGDPVGTRRKKMVEAIEQQRRLYRDPTILERWEGKRKPIAWIRRLGTTAYISPRYGMRPLELKPGMPVIKTHMEHVEKFLDTLKAMVENGTLDEQLGKLAERMSSDFHKAA